MTHRARSTGLVATLTAVVAFIMATGSAGAAERRFSAKVAGTFVTTAIDTDAAGSKAVLTMLEGSSSVGHITAQGVGEWTTLGAPVSCPAGNVEAAFVSAQGVLRAANGDLLYTEFSSGTSCTNPATGITTYTTDGTFNGGTGRFVGATGPIQATGIVQTLVLDPSGNAFGATTSEVAGTLVTVTP